MQRREFLGRCTQLGLGMATLGALAGCAREVTVARVRERPAPGGTPPGTSASATAAGATRLGNNRWQAGPDDVDVAIAQDMNPEELVRAAVARYGGISSWVKAGDVVAIKPNLAWARQPAQAA